MPELKFEQKIEERPKSTEERPESLEESELKYASKAVAVQMMLEARGEFPESFQEIFDKVLVRKALTPEEKSKMDSAISKWWKKKFGIEFSKRFRGLKKKEIEKLKKKLKAVYKKKQTVEVGGH